MSPQACLDVDYSAVVAKTGVRHILELVELASIGAPTLLQPGGGTRSLLELEGLGAAVWNGIDPVEYVAGLRDEWDAP